MRVITMLIGGAIGCVSIFGCSGSNAHVILHNGMGLKTALESLNSRGIAVTETVEQVDFPELIEFRLFIIKPVSGKDAMYFVVAPEGEDSTWRITTLYWYRNWARDSKLPKSMRKYHITYVSEVSLKDLKSL